MPFAHTLIQGRTGTFMRSTPRPTIRISKNDVDERSDTWFADSFPNDLLYEGAPHPHFPGLILDTASFDEINPAFPDSGTPGDYSVDCTWQGSHNSSRPTKITNNGERRTVGEGWDERQVEYLTWAARWKSCTGTASTDRIDCDGHAFTDGTRIVFARLTGGTGITPQSSFSLGTIYFVINATADGFQIALTAGGSAVDITTNLTAGEVIDAQFALGASHPQHATMFLASFEKTDTNTDWQRVRANYLGLEEAKPYRRMITVNGQQVSSSDKIIWNFTDGWSSPRYSNVQLPQIQVVDTYLTTYYTLDTATIPYSQGEGGSPPSPPSVRSVFIFGTDDTIVYNWPSGWSSLAEEHVDTLNSQIGVHLKRRVYEYIWPILLR